MRSRTWVSGCRRPMRGTRPGSVTSTASGGAASAPIVADRASPGLLELLFERVGVARRGSRRSSGGAELTDFRSAVMSPCLRPTNRSRAA